MARRRTALLIFALVETIILLGLGEIAIRILRPQPTYSVVKDLAEHFYAPSSYLPFTLQANYAGTSRSMEDFDERVKVTTNSRRTRGSLRPYDAKRKRILIVGDSYTFGVYVADHETYAAQLQQLVDEASCPVDVINAGYSGGWGPDSQYAWLRRNIASFDPDLVVFGFFIGNDLDDIQPANWISVDHEGLPSAIIDPAIYVDSKGQIRSRVRDFKTAAGEWYYRPRFLRESQLFIALGRTLNRVSGRYRRGQQWGTVPFRWIFLQKSDRSMHATEQVFYKLLHGMRSLSASNNSAFLVLMIPVNFQVDPAFANRVVGHEAIPRRDYFAELQRMDELKGIEFLNILEAMRRRPGAYYPANAEVHFNRAGHRFVAAAIAKWLAAHNFCSSAFSKDRS